MTATAQKFLSGNDSEDLASAWIRLRPKILAAVPYLYGTYDEKGILRAVLSGAFQFWPSEHAFLITTLNQYDNFRSVVILLAGGAHHECTELRKQVIAWAKERDADEIVTAIRPGIDRINKCGEAESAAGWKRRSIVYSMDLRDGRPN